MATYSKWDQRQLDIESGKELDRLPPKADTAFGQFTLSRLAREINLLSGRLEIQMRLIARIIAKMDPAFIQDEQDPDVKHRSDRLTAEVLKKMKQDALAQAIGDPEQFQKLQRYFKDLES